MRCCSASHLFSQECRHYHQFMTRRPASPHAPNPDQIPPLASDTFSVGQFVVFPRSFYEQSTAEPTANIANTYYAKWSLPSKVMHVKNRQLQVVEYGTGRRRLVPTSQCRGLPSDIPSGVKELNWSHIQHTLPRCWNLVLDKQNLPEAYKELEAISNQRLQLPSTSATSLGDSIRKRTHVDE